MNSEACEEVLKHLQEVVIFASAIYVIHLANNFTIHVKCLLF